MQVLKRSSRTNAKLSIVLLDWSVRESFHLLHYLSRQNTERSDFEVVVIEFFSRRSPALERFAGQVDTWVLLDMPSTCCYHKHLMYNAGIVFSRSDVLLFCDSDAMVQQNFVGVVLQEFIRNPNIVLHLDQFRNVRRDLYPFNYPSFEEVLGEGCINNVDGKTRGLANALDPLHERNYGACMAARRADLIEIGGADEHIDYLGHICGPYEMTFRLINHGRREIWHESEFLYHTWHPGQAGVGNYLGPHDGRHMSTTALEALTTRRVKPYVENAAIHLLRTGAPCGQEDLEGSLIGPVYRHVWALGEATPRTRFVAPVHQVVHYRGFRIEHDQGTYTARLIVADLMQEQQGGSDPVEFTSSTIKGIRRKIDQATGGVVGALSSMGSVYVLLWHVLFGLRTLARNLFRKLLAIPGKLARLVRGFLFRSRDRYWRFFMERSVLSGSLTSLLVNVYYLKKAGGLRSDRQVILLVDSRAFQYYVQVLSALKLLPSLQIVRMQDAREISAWVQSLATGGWNGRLIVGRRFYLMHHAVLSSPQLQKHIAVV